MWRITGLVMAGCLVLLLGAGAYLSGNIYLRDGHVAVPDAALDDVIPAAMVREDLTTLIAIFEETHVDFGAINGPGYAAAVRALKDGIDTPMTRADLYQALAPLNALLTDGHTGLRRPTEELDLYEREGGLYLPLLVQIRGDDIRVSRPFGPDSPLLPGDSLIAINGRPAGELARRALSHQSGENIALRQTYAERSFYRTLVLLGVTSPFTVEYERGGEPARVGLEGVTRPAYVARRENRGDGANAFEILDGDVAVLTFSDMPSSLGEFRRFLENGFAALAANDVHSLIIDIRSNGGGDSRAGDMLLRYIADRDYPGLERVDVRVTDRIKTYYESLLPPLFRWFPLNRFVPVLRRIAEAPAGSVFSIHPDGAAPAEWASRPAHAFEGEIYVLTGPATYSSAAIFAAPLRHFDQAVFIGEETGEPMVFFGENYVFDLPHSRLQAAVSHKRFDLVGNGDHRTGIQPHIPVEAGRALEAALTVIRDGSNGYPGRELAQRIIETSENGLFDPRIPQSDAWRAFREGFVDAASRARSDADLIAAFSRLDDTHLSFSHFELQAGGNAAEPPGPAGEGVRLRLDGEGNAVLTADRLMGDGVREALDEAIDEAIARNVRHLVLDLRGNPGGDFSAWPLVARLVSEPTSVAAIVTRQWLASGGGRPDEAVLRDYPRTRSAEREQLATSLMDDGLLVLEALPQVPRFEGRVSVLVDQETASTSELIAAILQTSGRAEVYGEISAGEVLNAQVFEINATVSLVMPVADVLLTDGRRLEGAGVVPDIQTGSAGALDAALQGPAHD